MKRTSKLAILLMSCLLLNGCIGQQKQECSSKIVAPGKPAETTPVRLVEDPLQDFTLDHPPFERNFDIVYRDFSVIPAALDIVEVTVELSNDLWHFKITTADKMDMLLDTKEPSQFGVFVDTDFNGVSDFLLATTIQLKGGVLVTPDFELVEEIRLSIEENSITLFAHAETLGDHFEWVAYSGYSPREGAYYRTRLEALFVVPEVDLAYADSERPVLVTHSLSGTGQQCQVVETEIFSCPPPDDPPGRQNVPGSTCGEGWMLRQKRCGDRKIELWCNCSSGGPPWTGGFFGKRVEKGPNSGWVAICPFERGENYQWDEDVDGDGIPDKVVHTVIDRGYDDEPDGFLDVMIYEYDFGTNMVTITNIERDYSTGDVVNTKPWPGGPVPPYSNPGDVPRPW